MPQLQNTNRIFIGIIVVATIAAVLGGGWYFRGKIRGVIDLGKSLLASRNIVNDGNFTNILFIHHSTGRNLIARGNVRGLFAAAGYDFWDHDYNHIGLTGPDSSSTGYSYRIPGDNTDPDGYENLFTQPLYSWPINAFSAIMQHEVIIFKSCFPVSNISDSETLDRYKRHYLSIREIVDQHPDRIFIALTPPSLTPKNTSPANAANARAFANWLQSDEFLDGRSNLHTFDFFDLLAESAPSALDFNMLRAEYRRENDTDSHPNKLANETIGPQLVEFITKTVESYR